MAGSAILVKDRGDVLVKGDPFRAQPTQNSHCQARRADQYISHKWG
jgi:hypothetical protein